MTDSQWRKWKAWSRIRGPVGGLRSDYYATYVAMHARHAVGNPDGTVSDEHFRLPWSAATDATPQPDDPYDVYDPKRDGEVYL